MLKSFVGATTYFIVLLVIMSTLSHSPVAQAEKQHGNVSHKNVATPSDQIAVILGQKSIQATVANTDSTRTQGLLGWSQIGYGQGMLLDFIKPGLFAIHMQGMKFPIDALWIDSGDVIKLIYEDIQPDSGAIYPSMFPVRYCLEVHAGFCKKHGVKEGQKVVFGN
ncbi:MAG: DUF192 domain-containing protein [Pseudomonadota bacterium]